MKFDPRKWGAKCDDCPLVNCTPIKPSVNRDATLVLLGEAPGKDEEIRGEFFIGRSGKIVDQTRERFGISVNAVHKTNALLCRPRDQLAPAEWKQAIDCCRPRLRKELGRVKSRTIAAMGAKALQALTGKAKIFDWIGAPLDGEIFTEKGKVWTPLKTKKYPPKSSIRLKRWQVLPLLHPAFIARYPWYGPVFQIHLKRAWDLSTENLKKWEWPETITWTDSRTNTLEGLRRILKAKKPIGVDVETAGINPMEDDLLDIAIANEDLAVSLPFTEVDSVVKGLVGKILASNMVKVMQNGQFDILSLSAHGFSVKNFAFDTLLAHAVVAPQLRHNLGFICAVEYHAPRWKDVFRVSGDVAGASRFLKADPTLRAVYNARDAWMTLMLMKPLSERLEQTPAGNDLFQSFMQLNKIAIKMRTKGVQVDPEKLTKHRRILKQRRSKSKTAIKKLAIKAKFPSFNPNAHRDVSNLFARKLGVQSEKFSEKTGEPSFDAKVLIGLCAHPKELVALLAREILKFRKWSKLLNTYIEGMPLDKENVCHPTWNVQGARTGRWSSQDPNVMNIPKPKYDKGKLVAPGLRDLFCAREGMFLIEADYSQLELRILALLSGDEELLKWYAEGRDVHTQNACDLFGIDTPTSKQRDLAKGFVYGCNYGGGPQTIWRSLVVDFPGLAISDIERLIIAWFRAHPAIPKWQQMQLSKGRRLGYVEAPISGRRHYFYGALEPTKCFNLPIQMSAADIINPAALRLVATMEPQESILFQVHDSLVTETDKPVLMRERMMSAMEKPVIVGKSKMAFPVDVKVGVNWASAVECKNLKDFSREIERHYA